MNLKNLAMWAIIIDLSVGLFNMFQNPKNTTNSNSLSFKIYAGSRGGKSY